jgi:hypothetical protein
MHSHQQCARASGCPQQRADRVRAVKVGEGGTCLSSARATGVRRRPLGATHLGGRGGAEVGASFSSGRPRPTGRLALVGRKVGAMCLAPHLSVRRERAGK